MGENVPLVISPSFAPRQAGHDDLLVTAQHAAILQHQRNEFPAQAGGDERFERLAPDEVARGIVEGHGPGQTGLERILALVHVVAVEIHRGFQAQRVARAQARGLHSLGIERAPYGLRGRRRQHDLETVFAGVARARHEPVAPFFHGKGAAEEHVERQRGCALRGGQQLRDLGARIRALHGEHGEIGALGELDAERRRDSRASRPDPCRACRR